MMALLGFSIIAFFSSSLLHTCICLELQNSSVPLTTNSTTIKEEPVVVEYKYTTVCPPGKDAIKNRCCSRCPPGEGMVKRCSFDKVTGTLQDTICQACNKEAHTFSSISSANANCVKCRPCTGMQVVAQECTVTSDTVCKCVEGYYRQGGSCLPCSKCPLGEGKVGNCSGTTDAKCVACKSSEFSDFNRRINNRECKNCTVCPDSYTQVTACSVDKDTECRNKVTGKLLSEERKPEPEKVMDIDTSNQAPKHWMDVIDNGNRGKIRLPPQPNNTLNNKGEPPVSRYPVDNNTMIPIYCAILGMVIFGLIIWVIFKYFQRRREGIKFHQTSNSLLPQSHPCHQSPPMQVSIHRGLATKPSSVDSGFGGSEMPVNAGVSRKFKDISSSRFQRLENVLCNNPDPAGWQKLAKELGYDDEAISQFESEADVVRQSPIRLMLKDWSVNDQHTLGALGKALHKAGRKDAVFLLKEADRHHHHHKHHRLQLKEEGLTEMCQV